MTNLSILNGASLLSWEELEENLSLGLARFDHGEIKELIGDLFERSFRDPPPDFPVHYVCVCNAGGAISILGYGHCTVGSRYYLGGGMCTDNRALRRLTKGQRMAIGRRGGVAQFLIENIFLMSKDKEAVFSYVGHPVAFEIDLRAGFVTTQFRHLIVHWTGTVPADGEQLIIDVHNLGPF